LSSAINPFYFRIYGIILYPQKLKFKDNFHIILNEKQLLGINKMTRKFFNVTLARQDTPGCNQVVHFNNAGAALMPTPVVESVVNHLELEANIGGYEAAEKVQDKIENVYQAISVLIGCQRDEIGVIENATRAWDMAFYSIRFKPGDKILTCMAEYSSNFLAFLQIANRTGAKVEVVPNDQHGQISILSLQKQMDKQVKLIAITHVPTNGGLVNPAKKVGEIAREAGVYYLLDACQSVGQLPVNVQDIKCDMLSATGRKYLRGPRGTGFLYVRRELIEELEPPFIDLHAGQWVATNQYEIRRDARRFENWETNYATKIGLGVAIEYALKWGIEAIWERILALAQSLRDRLNQIPGVRILDLGQVKCGIVSFTLKGRNPVNIKKQLQDQNINVSVSDLKSTRLDMESRSLASLVRASVHYYNNEDEINKFCEAINSLI
jgi:selenocysteine lyase/cysteine desulfurase